MIVYRTMHKAVRKLINGSLFFLYKYLPFRFGLNNEDYREKKLIVSFTSYPRRFKMVPIMLKSILYQSMKPDKIILYISQEECGRESIPEHLMFLKQYGLEIKLVQDNLKPHNKYFYSMQEYPNDIIITVDDDILYPRNTIKKLYNSYLKYPDCVSAARVHRIKKDKNGFLLPYNDWDHQYRKCREPSHNLIATGVGGVLYPPASLPQIAFDKEKIQRLSLNADDVWLKFMELLNDVKIIYVKHANDFLWYAGDLSNDGLAQENIYQSKNDIYIKNVMNHFGILSKNL